MSSHGMSSHSIFSPMRLPCIGLILRKSGDRCHGRVADNRAVLVFAQANLRDLFRTVTPPARSQQNHNTYNTSQLRIPPISLHTIIPCSNRMEKDPEPDSSNLPRCFETGTVPSSPSTQI